MVVFCCVYNCSERPSSESSLLFYSFPLQNETLLQEWLVSMGRENWLPTKHSRICSRHFRESDYNITDSCSIRTLKVDAVPCIFDPPEHLQNMTNSKPSPRKRVFKAEADENVEPFNRTSYTSTSINESNNELVFTMKKRRYLGDFPVNFTSLEEANEYRQMSQNVIERKEKQIKLLLQEKRRLKKQILDLKSLVEHLKELKFAFGEEN